METIPVVYKGQVVAVATVDDEDSAIRIFNWRPDKDGYPRFSRRSCGKMKDTRMHRLVFSRMIGRDLLSTESIDHIDRNKLNNTRANLRIASRSLNAANVVASRVTWHKGCRKWQSAVIKNGKCHYGGVFASRRDAEKRSAELMRELWPEVV